MSDNITCLLIDDDIDDQEIFAYAIEKLNVGITVITASSGNEALNKLQSAPPFIPDYIFLDLNMPVMHGKECLRAIRRLPHLQPVPVIIYTTSALEKDKEETKELGANGFITKQSNIDKLKNILISWFRKKRIIET